MFSIKYTMACQTPQFICETHNIGIIGLDNYFNKLTGSMVGEIGVGSNPTQC